MYDYQEVMFDPSMIPTNFVSTFWVRYYLSDSPAALCDPPKIPEMQCLLQSWFFKGKK